MASRWRKVCIASDLDAMEAFPPELVVSGVIYMSNNLRVGIAGSPRRSWRYRPPLGESDPPFLGKISCLSGWAIILLSGVGRNARQEVGQQFAVWIHAEVRSLAPPVPALISNKPCVVAQPDKQGRFLHCCHTHYLIAAIGMVGIYGKQIHTFRQRPADMAVWPPSGGRWTGEAVRGRKR